MPGTGKLRAFARALAITLVTGLACAAAPAGALAANWVVDGYDTGYDPMVAGGTVQYTVTVKNEASTAAPATNLSVAFTEGSAVFTSVSEDTGCTPGPGAAIPFTLSCPVKALGANETVTYLVRVRTTSNVNIRLTASVPTSVGSVVDTQPGNNSIDRDTTVVQGSDIDLTVAAPASPQDSGKRVPYVFTVLNRGPNTANSITVELTPTPGLSNITVPSFCSPSAGKYICNVPGPVAVNASVPINLSGQISAAPDATVGVTGTVTSSSPADPIPGNNQVTASTRVTPGSDLSLAKTVSSGIFSIGEVATFTLTASYTGASPSNLTITDTFPVNYAVTSVTPSAGSGWTCDPMAGQTLTCRKASGGAAGVNQSLGSITVRATVRGPITGKPTDATAGPPVYNTANISAARPSDPDTSNNDPRDGGAQIYDPIVDLRANKSSTATSVNVGSQFSYLISASNLTRTNPSSVPFVGKVTMRDKISEGLKVVSYTTNGWTCLPAASAAAPVLPGTEINCERNYTAASPLPVGGTTPSVILRAEATRAGPFLNELWVASPVSNGIDDNEKNNYIGIPGSGVSPDQQVDLQVFKSVTRPTVPAGDVQSFEIEVVNKGPGVGNTINVRDDLRGLLNTNVGPTGAGMISAVSDPPGVFDCKSTAFSNVPPTRRLDCTAATLPVCTARPCPKIIVAIRPGGQARTGQDNTATATSTGSILVTTGDDSATVTYDVLPGANLSLTKTASPASPVAGQNLTYTLTARVVPDGRDAAQDVTITDTLPPEVDFVSTSSPDGTCSADSATPPTVTCQLGFITTGAQKTATIVVRPKTVSTGTLVTNTAKVSSTTFDDVTENNTASVSVTPRAPVVDLQINKTDDPNVIAVGDTTVYTLEARNNGPSAATNVQVIDDFPATGLTYESHEVVTPGGSCSAVPAPRSLGGQLVCSFPRLLLDESAFIKVTMRGERKGVWTNRASVSSDEEKALPGSNNLVGQETTVRSRADLKLLKSVTPETAALGTALTYTIDLLNRTGTDPVTDVPLGETDATTITDTMQDGLVLTGAPVAVVSGGTSTLNSCTGATGGTSFRCDFGTLSNGATVKVTVPAKVASITSTPQTLTNTAKASTTSADIDPTNDSDTADVIVSAASLSGTVFKDFNGNGQQGPGDTGVGGVPVTLTGTADGAAVSITTTTAADGSYTFALLAPGNYTITRGPVSEPAFGNGQSVPGVTEGTPNGTASSPTVISGIVLATAAGTGYDFTLVPDTASIAITKAVASGPTAEPDGSFTASFLLTVSNPNAEELANVVVTDVLAGPAPLFGTFATEAKLPGTYSITGPPTGSCGGLRADYTGAGANTLAASGFTLAAGASCTITIALRVMPTDPLPPLENGGRYFNQASVSGEGSLSGQTPSAQSNRVPLSPELPKLTIVKELTGNSDPDASKTVTPGDVLSYRITATNAGSMTLTDVVVSDDRITPAAKTCASLAPGDACVLSGTYTVVAGDAQKGSVTNIATATSNETPKATATLTIPVVAVSSGLSLTKQALVSTAKRGEKVPYVIRAANVPFSPARLVDVMPPGFAFVEGSAVANGKAVAPAVDGRRLIFENILPDAKGSIRLTLTLIVTASVNPGTSVNQAQLINPATNQLVATAKAPVTILAEAIFDCTDVIGKVFDDRNRNGYQDEGEPGLPAVRIATVNGLLVTADAEGRFNVPCADIPDAAIGSNFVMKLDPRTLPTGYHVTTENPRRVRLTRGKAVKLNFGAALIRQVKLELNGAVFQPGSQQLKRKWEQGLDRLVAALATESSVLEITYRGEDGVLARARLLAVKQDIAQRWNQVPGRYDLAIDTRILSGGAP